MTSLNDLLPTLPELHENLNAILSNPLGAELDVSLVETFTAQLTEEHLKPLIPTLVPLVASTLAVFRQDPTPITNLLLRLLPETTFTEVLNFTEQETAVRLLSAPSSSVRQLGLWIIRKATASVSDVSIIASWSDVIKKLIEVLLLDDDTGVSSSAVDVLIGLLSVDLQSNGGTGLLWRRVMEDKGVYEVFFKICSWKGDELPGGKYSKTQGQGRFLQLVVSMAALDFDTTLTFPEIDSKYTGGEVCKGLLEFAAKFSVNGEEDVMMHMVLLDFYTSLLRETDVTRETSQKALDYLEVSGLHGSTTGRYLAPEAYSDDIIDQQLLESKAAEYIATFARLHPGKLVSSPSPNIPEGRNPKRRRLPFEASPPAPAKPLVDSLLERIGFILECNLRQPHTPSLDIISSLPTSVLATNAGKRVVAMIPLSPPSSGYINALTSVISKQGSSRQLYDHYISTHPEMWQKVTSYVSALALSDIVLSCMNLIEKLIVVQDSTGAYWGVKEVVSAPGVMSFLITPQRFAGSARDPTSTAFMIATRKMEVLETVLRVLGRAGNDVPGGERWKVVVEDRIRVESRGGAAGGEVATMEM